MEKSKQFGWELKKLCEKDFFKCTKMGTLLRVDGVQKCPKLEENGGKLRKMGENWIKMEKNRKNKKL